MKKILIFGMGYVGQHLARALEGKYEVVGTSRDATGQTKIKWNVGESSAEIAERISQADAILCSIPPNDAGDLAYMQFGEQIKKSKVKWIGYLSTTGVYGDHQGGRVDETTPLNAQNARAKKRVMAEAQWSELASAATDKISTDRSVHIFRLPGIYGVGRSAFEALKPAVPSALICDLRMGISIFSVVRMLMTLCK